METKSRYDDPEYRKQVSLQMMATPTLEIACRAITDLRQRIKDLEHLYDVAHGANSPENHFNYFMQELDKRFPAMKSHVRNKARVDLTLAEIDKVLTDSKELNRLKAQVINMVTGGKLFQENENEQV